MLLSSRSTFFFPHTHFYISTLKVAWKRNLDGYIRGGAEFYRSVEKLKICKGNRKPEKIVGKPNEVTERAKEFFSFISGRMSLHGITRPWNFFVRCWNRNWPTWMCVKNENYNDDKLARKECFDISSSLFSNGNKITPNPKYTFFSSFPKL